MYYTDYATYISRFFKGKVQKISLNVDFGCPNRNGSIGTGGCIYCNNTSFTPRYCFGKMGIREQLEAGKEFFGRKYPNMRYLAYFQSYTNTMADADILVQMWREALGVAGVIGLVIGTRPDCLPIPVLDALGELAREVPVFVELGAETSHDSTLQLINRGHNWQAVEDAAYELSSRGVHVGLHLIMGLPGETEEMMLTTVDRACALPVESLKIHHLQVLAHTPLAEMYKSKKIEIVPFEVDRYIELCVKIINRVPTTIAIERFLASAPPEMVIAPHWGLKNYQFADKLKNRLKIEKLNN